MQCAQKKACLGAADMIVLSLARRRLAESPRYSLGKLGLGNVPPGSLPGGIVDLDVDENHNAAGDVEGAEGAVHHVPKILAQLQEKRRKTKSIHMQFEISRAELI